MRRTRKTDRSRLASAIKLLAKGIIGKDRGRAPLTSSATGLLEDISRSFISRIGSDCTRLLEKRKTVDLSVMRSAVQLNVRNAHMFKEVNSQGEAWMNAWNNALTNKPKDGVTRIKTSGKDSVLPGKISPHRILTILRRLIPGCHRLSFLAAVYLAGVLDEVLTIFIGATHKGDSSVPTPKRLTVNDFYEEARQNMDLNCIVRYSSIVRFGGDKDIKMPRKGRKKSTEGASPDIYEAASKAAGDSDSDSDDDDDDEPPPLRKRAAPKKKNAPAKKKARMSPVSKKFMRKTGKRPTKAIQAFLDSKSRKKGGAKKNASVQAKMRKYLGK